jgi:hypothetical protein
MPSVRAMKCPVCGVQEGPCIGGTPTKEYHVERFRAANPTTYEHPDCKECRQLKDAMVDAEWSLRTCRPDVGIYKSRSRWPNALREEHYQREKAARGKMVSGGEWFLERVKKLPTRGTDINY